MTVGVSDVLISDALGSGGLWASYSFTQAKGRSKMQNRNDEPRMPAKMRGKSNAEWVKAFENALEEVTPAMLDAYEGRRRVTGHGRSEVTGEERNAKSLKAVTKIRLGL